MQAFETSDFPGCHALSDVVAVAYCFDGFVTGHIVLQCFGTLLRDNVAILLHASCLVQLDAALSTEHAQPAMQCDVHGLHICQQEDTGQRLQGKVKKEKKRQEKKRQAGKGAK